MSGSSLESGKTSGVPAAEPLAERVERLFRELERALRFDRPSILLAVYASEFVRLEAEAALADRLRDLGLTVNPYRVTGEEDADIPLHLAHHPAKAGTVFFVSGLQWGGGPDGRNAYRALNLRREYFVDYRLRAVFWLTEQEAIALPGYAPDFWAFRHRAVEFVEAPEPGRVAPRRRQQGEYNRDAFVEAPEPGRVAPLARELAWAGFEDRTLGEETGAKIALREALLADLPDGEETLTARADLLFTLAGLYWAKRAFEKSIELWQQALRLAERLADARRQARCYNGLGNVYRDLGRPEEALAAYRRAIELDPKFAAPHHGLGNVYAELGRYDEALAAYRRAIELDPQDAYPHHGLGVVYADLGRYDEAIAAFERAIELDPQDAYPYNGLADVYYLQGEHRRALELYRQSYELQPRLRPLVGMAGASRHLGDQAQAARYVEQARALSPGDYNLACLEGIDGNVEAALEHLHRALEQDPSQRAWARRDPNLDFIRADPRFRALVGEGD